jgi:ribose-phosphate pyrophosphokinase
MSIKVVGADVEFIKFPAGEPHVKVKNVKANVKITWNFESFEEFMYVAMIVDVVKKQWVADVTLAIPYLPFARQDRYTSPEQPFSLNIFCNMLKTLHIDCLRVADAHSEVFFEEMKDARFEVVNKTQLQCLLSVLGFEDWYYMYYSCVIAPDKGAQEKVSEVASMLGSPLVCASKVRDPVTGKLSSPSVDFGAIIPTRILISDDCLDGGFTFTQLADLSIEKFPDVVLDLYVTHGIFSKGKEEINKRFNNIFVYNDMSKGDAL